jgi:hypothetical protein
MLHGHELAQVIAIERPGVNHLFSVSIDDQNVLTALNVRRLAPSRRDLNRGWIHSPASLEFGSARAAGHCKMRLTQPLLDGVPLNAIELARVLASSVDGMGKPGAHKMADPMGLVLAVPG